MKNFYIKTFGCQMNEYDSDKISDLLCSLKYSKVHYPEDANYVVFNTCHIREKANQKLYSDIGKIKKELKNKKKNQFLY